MLETRRLHHQRLLSLVRLPGWFLSRLLVLLVLPLVFHSADPTALEARVAGHQSSSHRCLRTILRRLPPPHLNRILQHPHPHLRRPLVLWVLRVCRPLPIRLLVLGHLGARRQNEARLEMVQHHDPAEPRSPLLPVLLSVPTAIRCPRSPRNSTIVSTLLEREFTLPMSNHQQILA
jgi:hypothetical protein